jgi:O-antigen ligase
VKTLTRLSLWALALTPLILIDNITTLFGKMIFVRVMLLLASAFFFFCYIDKPKFRTGVRGRASAAVRSPLVLSILAFVSAAAISTALAVSPFKGFFGNLDRSEGLLGLLCYFVFFAYSYLVFSHKDWVVFFKINVSVGIITVIKAISEFAGGVPRPKAFTGNTEYLAGYLLFAIFAAIIVFVNSPKKSVWRYVAAIGGVGSVIGIGLTQTRGAILGLAVAVAVLLVYGIICGKDLRLIGRLGARKTAIILLILATAGGGFFWTTKNATIWQKIPGISRIAQADRDSSSSISTRLISLKTSWKAATESGVVRDLFGYGPDNFNIAFNRYYDPAFYKYEHGWFDRAHNKLADVVVMNGWLGLLAYLAIWVSLAYLALRKRPLSGEYLALLAVGSAYFAYLMTVFDQVSTYISFFAVLAFVAGISIPEQTNQPVVASSKKKVRGKHGAQEQAPKSPIDIVIGGLVCLALIWVMVVWTFIPFNQLSNYRIMMIQAVTDSNALADIDSAFTPYTFCQQEIRQDFLRSTAATYSKDPTAYGLFQKALTNMEETERIEPYNPLYLLQAGLAYDQKWARTKDIADLKQAERYYRRGLALAPLRQDVAYALSTNLVNQGRVSDALALMLAEVAADAKTPESHFYLGSVMSNQGENQYSPAMSETERAFSLDMPSKNYPATSADVYRKFARYFYSVRDKVNFITAMSRLDQLAPADRSAGEAAIKAAEDGTWPELEIK